MILASDILNGRARPAPSFRDLLRALRPNRGTGRDSAFVTADITPDNRDDAAQSIATD